MIQKLCTRKIHFDALYLDDEMSEMKLSFHRDCTNELLLLQWYGSQPSDEIFDGSGY